MNFIISICNHICQRQVVLVRLDGMNPTISIIIPTYNEEKYLPALLESIKKQTLKPFEVIVVDANSEDLTRTAARKYQFTRVIKKKGGPAVQRNFGAHVAKGELLVFLDADVVLPKTFLEDSIAEMTRKRLKIASCLVRPLSSRKRDKVMHELVNYYLTATKSFFLHAPGCCIFVYRNRHESIKGFDEKLFLAEDHDYVQRASRKSKFSYLRSHKIPVSTRRLEREGRWTITWKYVFSEFHLFFLGKIRRPLFLYTSE